MIDGNIISSVGVSRVWLQEVQTNFADSRSPGCLEILDDNGVILGELVRPPLNGGFEFGNCSPAICLISVLLNVRPCHMSLKHPLLSQVEMQPLEPLPGIPISLASQFYSVATLSLILLQGQQQVLQCLEFGPGTCYCLWGFRPGGGVYSS